MFACLIFRTKEIEFAFTLYVYFNILHCIVVICVYNIFMYNLFHCVACRQFFVFALH